LLSQNPGSPAATTGRMHAGMMMEQSQTLLSSAAEGEAPPEEAEAVWDITRQSAR